MGDRLLQQVTRSVELNLTYFANAAGIQFGNLQLLEPVLIDDTHVGIYKLAWRVQILDTKYLDEDLTASIQDNWIHGQIWFTKGQPKTIDEIQITLFNTIIYTYYKKLDKILKDLNKPAPQELP